jgi:peptidoglycan hydrolase-like protein with peptidoglycan-binding domain
VQQRLRRLGFDPGPIDGVVGRRTTRAVSAFQAHHGLEATGVIDDATRARLLLLADDDTRVTDAEEDMAQVDGNEDGAADADEGAEPPDEALAIHESMEDEHP